MIDHLSNNFIRQKFDGLIEIITRNIDILMILETKLDESFPKGQFLIKGFSQPYGMDCNSKGGGMLFVREDVPSRLLSIEKKFDQSFSYRN